MKYIPILLIFVAICGCSIEIKGEVTTEKQSFSLKVDGLELFADKDMAEDSKSNEDIGFFGGWIVTIPLVTGIIEVMLSEEILGLAKDILFKIAAF